MQTAAGHTQLARGPLPQLSPLAKWLYQFYAVHKQPSGYKVETIRALCGSQVRTVDEFREPLQRALRVLVDIRFLSSWTVDAETDVLTVHHE